MSLHPIRLASSFREKIWGREALEPIFPSTGRKIGEVWFTLDDADPALLGPRVPPGSPLPLLVKFIFTSERLSVQVHPDDIKAAEWENSKGKTEMWHILGAEPGASIAVGFHQPVSKERLRQSALSGEIARLLRWFHVNPGETYLIPAGTVHAIGAGVVLLEIQQNSDVTYRLYDYGRPRELHLDKAIAVSRPEPYPGPVTPVETGPGVTLLAACDYFVTERLEAASPFAYQPDPVRFHLLSVVAGAGAIGDQPFEQGQVWLVPSAAPAFPLCPMRPTTILRSYVP